MDYVTFNTYSQDVLGALTNPKASVIADVINHRGTTAEDTDVLVCGVMAVPHGTLSTRFVLIVLMLYAAM